MLDDLMLFYKGALSHKYIRSLPIDEIISLQNSATRINKAKLAAQEKAQKR